MTKWFQTWNRPEYQEWAKKIDEGYLLLIIRKEKDRYLCVKAKLLMAGKGLPGLEVLEELHFTAKNDAIDHIQKWNTRTIF